MRMDRLISKWLMHGDSRASDADRGGWQAASFVIVGQVVPRRRSSSAVPTSARRATRSSEEWSRGSWAAGQRLRS